MTELNVPENIDLEADANEPVGDLKEATELAARMLSLENEIIQQTLKLKQLSEAHREIETVQLPELMNELNLKKFTLGTGHEIEIKKIVKAALPTVGAIEKAKGDKKEELIARLNEGLTFIRSQKNGESLIKHMVALEFSKGMDSLVSEFITKAEELQIPHKDQSTVHPATLSKFIEELMEQGVNVPKGTLGVFSGQVAKVKKPKGN